MDEKNKKKKQTEMMMNTQQPNNVAVTHMQYRLGQYSYMKRDLKVESSI